MVANNFLGADKRATTTDALGLLSVSKSSNIDLEREKKATSVPEIKADKNNKTNNKIASNTIDHCIEKNKEVNKGSGSTSCIDFG